MGKFSSSLKTVVLLALLTALMLFIGNWAGGTVGLVIAFFFVIVLNGAAYWWSDKMVLSMYKAQEFPAHHHVTKLTHELARKYELPLPKVFLLPSASPNAFATGRNQKKGVVAVSQGLLDLLNEKELKGVIAHELTHIKNHDILISTITAMVAGVISYVASIAQWTAIFGGFNGNDDGPGMLELLVLIIVTPLIATIIQLAVSRTREYAADAGAARLLRDGSGLRSALLKLEQSTKSKPMRYSEASAATEHLFIVNPFSGKSFMRLFSTHPLTEDRVRRLEEMDVY